MMKNLTDIISENVRFYRSRTGLSQMKLALELDIAPSYLAYIETGKQLPSLHIVERLANYFHIQPYEILYPKDESCGKPLDSDYVHSLRVLKEQIDAILDTQIENHLP